MEREESKMILSTVRIGDENSPEEDERGAELSRGRRGECTFHGHDSVHASATLVQRTDLVGRVKSRSEVHYTVKLEARY